MLLKSPNLIVSILNFFALKSLNKSLPSSRLLKTFVPPPAKKSMSEITKSAAISS